MQVLLNSTKTMDATARAPRGLRVTRPAFAAEAATLMRVVKKLGRADLVGQMALSEKLADETRALAARWGGRGESAAPALAAFTGLVYKHVGALEWSAAQWRDAQQRLVILSGLYGLLRPLDKVAPYRLEMGSKVVPPGAKNLVAYWREDLTAALGKRVKKDEPVLNLAAQEYVKALDPAALKGPLVSPVFKETRPDGSLKTAPVHAKIARGAMVRYVFETGAQEPADLLAFGVEGWEASCAPPESGPWLFTRPVRT